MASGVWAYVVCLISVTVLGGQVGGRRPCPGLGGALARHSARAASPPFAPCFAHTCGAELFHQPPTPASPHQTRPRLRASVTRALVDCAGPSSSPTFAARAPLGVINPRWNVLLVHCSPRIRQQISNRDAQARSPGQLWQAHMPHGEQDDDDGHCTSSASPAREPWRRRRRAAGRRSDGPRAARRSRSPRRSRPRSPR